MDNASCTEDFFCGFERIIQNIVKENNLKQSLIIQKQMQAEALEQDIMEKEERIKILKAESKIKTDQNKQLWLSISLRKANIERLSQHVKLLEDHESSLRRQLTYKRMESKRRIDGMTALLQKTQSLFKEHMNDYQELPIVRHIEEMKKQFNISNQNDYGTNCVIFPKASEYSVVSSKHSSNGEVGLKTTTSIQESSLPRNHKPMLDHNQLSISKPHNSNHESSSLDCTVTGRTQENVPGIKTNPEETELLQHALRKETVDSLHNGDRGKRENIDSANAQQHISATHDIVSHFAELDKQPVRSVCDRTTSSNANQAAAQIQTPMIVSRPLMASTPYYKDSVAVSKKVEHHGGHCKPCGHASQDMVTETTNDYEDDVDGLSTSTLGDTLSGTDLTAGYALEALRTNKESKKGNNKSFFYSQEECSDERMNIFGEGITKDDQTNNEHLLANLFSKDQVSSRASKDNSEFSFFN